MPAQGPKQESALALAFIAMAGALASCREGELSDVNLTHPMDERYWTYQIDQQVSWNFDRSPEVIAALCPEEPDLSACLAAKHFAEPTRYVTRVSNAIPSKILKHDLQNGVSSYSAALFSNIKLTEDFFLSEISLDSMKKIKSEAPDCFKPSEQKKKFTEDSVFTDYLKWFFDNFSLDRCTDASFEKLRQAKLVTRYLPRGTPVMSPPVLKPDLSRLVGDGNLKIIALITPDNDFSAQSDTSRKMVYEPLLKGFEQRFGPRIISSIQEKSTGNQLENYADHPSNSARFETNRDNFTVQAKVYYLDGDAMNAASNIVFRKSAETIYDDIAQADIVLYSGHAGKSVGYFHERVSRQWTESRHYGVLLLSTCWSSDFYPSEPAPSQSYDFVGMGTSVLISMEAQIALALVDAVLDQMPYATFLTNMARTLEKTRTKTQSHLPMIHVFERQSP